ncbi:mechanosensitive ion channel family protein [Variovorax saccharolyticus]|uniref:mechanosensitive ion channel family protein n=1 Tax=Variovorax saccharolyticus TaxID=3053516 RepID=UPI0025749C8E|nr:MULTISPECIES: mechanosensitive ion channel domain-containing protein [unclassified Variovorax]MDM0021684.1 mechanosensitive ion channel [Variovorax sp. J22R187]MDM0028061.1 mechanosensitive ion channel [Variovorax sp. J31P216]
MVFLRFLRFFALFGSTLQRGACLLALLLTVAAGGAAAQEPSTPDTGAALKVWNRPVFVFRVPMFGLSPQQRAQRAAERIGDIPAASLGAPVEVASFAHEGLPGYAVMLEGATLFAIFASDLEPGDPALAQVAGQAAARLHQALLARKSQSSTRQFASSLGWVALASGLLVAVLLALQAVGRRVEARMQGLRSRAAARPLFDPRRIGVAALGRAVQWFKFALMLMAVYVWLAYVLTRFPYTRPWGETLDASLIAVASRVAVAVLHALPDLAMVAFIFLLAHLGVRGLHALFNAAHATGVKMAALQSDTIGATRRLTVVLVWLFALVVAYPFIPGSDSNAFKGLSVFFGVLVTLGSSGLVSQIMSGFVLIYSRALRPGDYVQIGESEGYVVELGTLSTKLRNRLDQEVTLPNSVVVGTRILNSSDTTKTSGGGIAVSTSVTIGYDSPWRQVQAMLVMAAGRTPDLLAEPRPTVRQVRLQDFYVEYELNVFMRAGAPKYDVLNILHGHIQDVFNEYGVQIMSPNFVLQPATPVLVAREDWRPAPAE